MLDFASYVRQMPLALTLINGNKANDQKEGAALGKTEGTREFRRKPK